MISWPRLLTGLLCGLMAFGALGGCGGRQFTHLDPTEDMGAQPGLLSRDKGYFDFTIDIAPAEE